MAPTFLQRFFKPYRAYRELDGYTDEQCRRLMFEAKRRRDDAGWFIPLCAAVLAAGVWWSVAGIVLSAAWSLAMGARAFPAGGAWWFAAGTGAALFVGTWGWVARRLVMRSVLNNLERIRCPYCWYSLRGLPVKYGRVVCPECGEEATLAELGLTGEGLLRVVPARRAG